MKFKKFYHDNLFTWKFCLKLCTILFSIIYIGIGIAIGFKTGEFENFFFIFFSSILLGVMTSFIIAILSLTSAYYENKKLLSIYEQTPKIIIDNFNLNLYNTHKNEKYNFKRYVILGFSEKYIIELNHNENLKNIFITLKMNLTLIENYSKKSLYIKKIVIYAKTI